MSVRLRIVIAVVALLIVAGLGYWFATHFERVNDEIRTPMKTEARRNPMLALERTLKARQHTVFSRRKFGTQDFGDASDSAIVLDLDPRRLRDAEVEALLAFVGKGATLLMRMPDSAEGRPGKLLDQLGIEPLEPKDGCTDIHTDTKRPYRFCGGTRIGGDLIPHYTQLARDTESGDGYWFAHAWYDDGHVYVVRDLDMLHNGELIDHPEAIALARSLLTPVVDRTRIHLFRDVDAVPFHVWLVQVGWPVMVPAFLALLLWLWQRSQRVGPIQPDAPKPRRALLEHVRASGEFLFRFGQPMAMHRALVARVQRRLAEREPAISALPESERLEALAVRSGIPVATLRHAFQPIGLGHPETFTQAIATLLQLERLP